VNCIETLVNVDVGSYVWAKFGFKAMDLPAFVNTMNAKVDYLRERRKVTVEQYDLLKKTIQDNQHEKLPWVMADLQIDGIPLGRTIMMNLRWEADLNLYDREAMARFTKYVNQR